MDSVPDNKNLLKLKRKKIISWYNSNDASHARCNKLFWEKNNFKSQVENLIIVDPTAPLRNINDINRSVLLFKKPDLLVSVHNAQHNPYFSMLEKKENFMGCANLVLIIQDQGNKLKKFLKLILLFGYTQEKLF